MSLSKRIKKAWKDLVKWVKDKLGRGKRDKTPMPISNFTVEIEP